MFWRGGVKGALNDVCAGDEKMSRAGCGDENPANGSCVDAFGAANAANGAAVWGASSNAPKGFWAPMELGVGDENDGNDDGLATAGGGVALTDGVSNWHK